MPGTVTEAVESGDRRKALKAMAAKLAESMDDADPAVVAQIAGRLQAVLSELSGMPSEESAVDELVARRQARRAAADSQLRPKQRRRTERRT